MAHTEERPSPTAVALELVADPTLGYASWQNNVPAVRALAITNTTDETLDDVHVTLSFDPPLADPYVIRFERLASRETRRVTPVDVKCSHHDLANRTELERVTLYAWATAGDQEVGRTSLAIEVLAYDQWAGSRALPELLAAFCAPNNPVVDQLIGKAAKALSSRGLSMNGYQSGARDAVLTQIAALYGVIAAEGLSYSNPPASFGNQGQKIRTPDRIADGRVATCLDAAMLFASCLEQMGLNPVVLLMKSHAWVGCWLMSRTFADPTTDDIQAVRKRVDAGELLTFETTLVTQQPPGVFKAACARGREHLDEADFEFAIDVAAARSRRILPLPSRFEAQAPAGVATSGASTIDEVPELPPLDPTTSAPDLTVDDKTPAGRIARWEAKLLDLTLRNRLLNFKPTNSNMELVIPDAHALEDRLCAGEDFRIEPKPALMEGNDPRAEAVHVLRTGERPLREHAMDLMQRGRLLALVEEAKLPSRLLEIFTNAQLSEQEGGSNTLFLALGLLKWRDDEKGDRDYLAPIILIPVTLKRQSVRSGYELKRHDDETLINPTLLHLLKTNYQLTVRGLDAIPMDDNGVDVQRIWAAFRGAIANVPGWEVLERSFLGIFSFTKYLMWRDLHARLADLKENRVVAQLVDNKQADAEDHERFARDTSLDDAYLPQELFVPKLADSSQLKAIAMADANMDFVLDGPPGTGKSQTITNIIADSLAKGKTVLFVSEKIAALNVVHTRLEEVGVGPFCLELHSAKAKKTEVMKQLGRALEFAGGHSVEEWDHEASRLAALRGELNELVRVLHHVHPNGLTVYGASGLSILNNAEHPAHFEWTNSATHDRKALDLLREIAKRIQALAAEFRTLKAHGLEGIVRTAWSPTWEDDLFRQAGDVDSAAAELDAAGAAAASACGLSLTLPSLATLSAFDTLGDVLLRAPCVPAGLAARACDAEIQSFLKKLRTHGEQRRQVWASFAGYRSSVAALDGDRMEVEWRAACATWWPKRWFDQRRVRGQLRAHREDLALPRVDQIDELLAQLTMLNTEDRALAALEPVIAPQLGGAWRGLETDWPALARHESWCKAFEEASARFVGGDIAAIAAMRTRLTALVSEHQALLAPNQPAGAALARVREAFRNYSAAAKALEELAGGGSLTGHADESAALTRIRSTLQRWNSARRQARNWCQWQAIRSQAIAQGMSGLIVALESGAIEVAQVVDFFEYSYQSWWLKRVIDKEPVLLNFASADHDRKIRDFRVADAHFEKLTEKYLVAQLAERVPNTSVPTGAESELGKLRRELQRQRGLSPIRQMLSQMPTLLAKLKPCLLMSPLSVAQYLDASHKFDLVVFDEASQIPVWDAVGAIARGKQLIVAGDEMQLPPTSFFQKAYDSEENIAEDEVTDLESVLNECRAVGLARQRLGWHYRSRHEALIAFSNTTYYDGNLITFPSPVTHDTSVSFRHVPGVYDRGASKTNRAEAEAIVDEIEDHYLDQARRGKSVGVVTFNQPQMALIQQLLDGRRAANPELDQVLAEIEHEELFVKNLENVQGDERDVILFSITYGPDAAGKVNMTMGPLTKEGGHRRLNVAITRAREQVILFSTLLPEHIDTARASGQGVADLKAYLDFARRGKVALLSQSSPTGLNPDSPFEVAVIKALRAKGWTLHPQVGCSGYRVDIGVVNPDAPGEYLMGVECDGRTYHSAATARDRDRLRQLVLERLGWRLHRIWSTDWWTDQTTEIDKLDRALKERLAARAKGGDGEPTPPVEPRKTHRPSDDPVERVSQKETYAKAPESARQPAEFVPHTLGKRRGKRFDEWGSDNELRDQILELVNSQGPIAEDEAFRQVARAWDIARVGSRVAERLAALRPAVVQVTTSGGRFYWPPHIIAEQWRGFRVAGQASESRRQIYGVAIEEIANAASYLLANGGETLVSTLAKDVCRLIGMARITADAEARARLGVQLLTKKGRAIVIDDDRVKPAS
jgi:very-short-patch-repair endonuclease